MKLKEPNFLVGNIPIYGDLILSPMDGISDLPFRSLARQLGSAMSYTEFVNAVDVLRNDWRLQPILAYEETERPVVFQIYDSEPARILQAVLKLQELGPDIIDVNMGCPAKTVSNRGAGVGLMREPAKIAEIFQMLSKALRVPVTGKIRLGWDASTRNYLEVAKIVEDNGGSLLAVHGRTKEQGYGGRADWDAIATIKQNLSIPVIGNGDVKTVDDIDRIKKHTGCDGVMIGRAAISNPWIFSRLDRTQVPASKVFETARKQLESMIAFYGRERGMLIFRKFAIRYIGNTTMKREERTALLTTEDPSTFLSMYRSILDTGLLTQLEKEALGG